MGPAGAVVFVVVVMFSEMIPLFPTQPLSLASGLLFGGKQVRGRAGGSQGGGAGVEWSGMEWSGVEWSGVEWSGVEWSGVEWSAGGYKSARRGESGPSGGWGGAVELRGR